MRKKIVAGNWKMNLTYEEALELHSAIEASLSNITCEVYHFVPSIYLKSIIDQKKQVQVGAQNAHPQPKGAFTGEVSMQQIKTLGSSAVLIGHSERRLLFNETDIFLKEKVDAAIQNQLTVFFCCGESLQQREQDAHEEVIAHQLNNSLFHLSESDFKNIIIAYEPIWAIGTGKTATSEQANAMHKHIRNLIQHKYSLETAEATTILYGGSCNPTNAQELFSKSDIDGGLIGGASLKSNDFLSIISVYND
ncbi:MAG: triose-phosphate isomerase [Brumimicrobium sp.]|nr:triose-phosphate isomerase [Brumimicrobium sp.]